MILFLMLTRLVWASVWIITKRKIAMLNSALGVTVSNVFIILYFYIYFNRSCFKSFLSAVVILTAEGSLLYGMVLWGDYLALSYIAMVCKILMSVAPGQKILRVIREKNYKLIPIYSALTNFFCSLSWLCYGICIKLFGQIFSNVIGVFFSLANTLIWLYFYIKRDKENDENEKELEDKDDKDKEDELIGK